MNKKDYIDALDEIKASETLKNETIYKIKEKTLEYYSKLANWDFSEIKYEEEYLTNWEYFDQIKKNTNEKSLCLDIGTGGGEKILKKYPAVRMLLATDFSKQMIETAKENAQKYPEKNVKFAVMDNLKMTFPDELFDFFDFRSYRLYRKYKIRF